MASKPLITNHHTYSLGINPYEGYTLPHQLSKTFKDQLPQIATKKDFKFVGFVKSEIIPDLLHCFENIHLIDDSLTTMSKCDGLGKKWETNGQVSPKFTSEINKCFQDYKKTVCVVSEIKEKEPASLKINEKKFNSPKYQLLSDDPYAPVDDDKMFITTYDTATQTEIMFRKLLPKQFYMTSNSNKVSRSFNIITGTLDYQYTPPQSEHILHFLNLTL